MEQRGSTELINTGQLTEVRTGPAEHGPGEHGLGEHGPGEPGPGELSGADAAVPARTNLDATLARTLRRFIAEVSKADQPQVSSEASQKRVPALREQGKRAAHLLWGR
jgi:hypothetical protein